MPQRLFQALVSLPKVLAKIVNWLINPKNGSNYVTPLNRHYLSTGIALFVTVFYRTTKGLYNFVTSYLLGSLVYIFQVALGIALDLWRANPSYSRWMAQGLVSTAIFMVSSICAVAQITGKNTYVGIVAISNSLR